VNCWLEPRLTGDVEITVAADAAEIESLRERLVGEGFAVARQYGADAPSGPDFIRFVSTGDEIGLEIQTAKTDLQRSVLERAVRTAEGIRVATVEDLIILKLIADRPKDHADILGLLALAALDWLYLEKWAAAWGVAERLEPRTTAPHRQLTAAVLAPGLPADRDRRNDESSHSGIRSNQLDPIEAVAPHIGRGEDRFEAHGRFAVERLYRHREAGRWERPRARRQVVQRGGSRHEGPPCWGLDTISTLSDIGSILSLTSARAAAPPARQGRSRAGGADERGRGLRERECAYRYRFDHWSWVECYA
jgi:hypothetical protein